MLDVFKRTSFIGKARYYFLDRYYNRFVIFGLVGLCIFLTLLSTLLWRDVTPKTLLVGFIPIILIAAITFVTLMYVNMEWAGLVPIIVSTILSEGIATGTGTKVSFTLLILILWTTLWLFKMIIVERNLRIRPSLTNIPALLFIITVIISFLWSSIYVESRVSFLFTDKLPVRVVTGLVIIISVVTFFLYSNHIRSVRFLRTVVWWFIIVGGVFVVMRIGLGEVPAPLNARGQFPTWVGILSLGQVLFNDRLQRWQKIVLLAILAGWVYVTFTLGLSWLSGWLPLVGGCMILLFLYSRPIFFTILIIGVSALIVDQAFVEGTVGNESTESGETRVDAWNQVFNVVGQHPLFGTGPGGYFFYFSTTLSGYFQLSHNNYVDIVGQTGVVGISLWLIFWGSVGVLTWRTYKSVPANKGFQRALANTLLASYCCTMIAMMLGDWVTPFPYTQTLAGVDYTIWAWILAGLTAALYYINRDQQNAEIQDSRVIAEGQLVKAGEENLLPDYAAPTC